MKGHSFYAVVVALILLSVTPAAAAFDPGKDELDALITMSATWSGRVRGEVMETGSASLTLSGTIKRVEQTAESLRYHAGEMKAVYRWNRKYYETDEKGACESCCPKGTLLSVQSASGTQAVPEEKFWMDVYLGDLGDQVAAKEGCPGPVDGVYQFRYWLMFDTPIQYAATGCSPLFPPEGTYQRESLGVSGHKVLDEGGMQGSYQWRTGIIFPRGFDLSVFDYCSGARWYPDVPDAQTGAATFNVNWQIGEVQPVVKISLHQGGSSRDITDAPARAVPVIVGQKIQLEARLMPPGEEGKEGEWKLGDEVIAGYEANDDKGEVKQLTHADRKQEDIDFFFVDSAPEGVPRTITYKTTVGGKKIEGKTILTVFEPLAKVTENHASDHFTTGISDGMCQVYYGKKLGEKGGKEVGEPGVYFESEITMPKPFTGKPYSLAYAQLIKELRLDWSVTYRYQEDDFYYYQKSENKKLCLDTQFPYADSYGGKFDDSPGMEVKNRTLGIFMNDTLETYLLFKPCGDPKSGDCAWIPLRKFKWSWGATAERSDASKKSAGEQPCDANHFPVFHKLKAKPDIEDWSKHPEWSCNVEDNKTEYVEEEEWNKAFSGHWE